MTSMEKKGKNLEEAIRFYENQLTEKQIKEVREKAFLYAEIPPRIYIKYLIEKYAEDLRQKHGEEVRINNSKYSFCG